MDWMDNCTFLVKMILKISNQCQKRLINILFNSTYFAREGYYN